MGKRKIRNYLISKNLQLRITLKFVVPALFLSILSGLVVFLIVWPLLSEFVSDTLIKQFQTIMVIGLFLCSIGIICLITALGIVVTHRIAGPIYRIEQDLKRLLQGEKIEPIHIRRGDEFQEFVNIINQVIERYYQGSSKE
jgi:signal transduction histidine kinase